MSIYKASARRGRLRKKGTHWPHVPQLWMWPNKAILRHQKVGHLRQREPRATWRSNRAECKPGPPTSVFLSSCAKCDVITPTLGVVMIECVTEKALRAERNQALRHHYCCCFPQLLPTPFKNSSFIKISLNYLTWVYHMFPARPQISSVSDIFPSRIFPTSSESTIFFLKKKK